IFILIKLILPSSERGNFDHLKGKLVKDSVSKRPKGNASDLLKLILYPENKLNSSNNDNAAGIDNSGDDRNNSAILCSLPLIDIPFISVFCLIASARGSRASANKRGLSGHPCLVPLASGKGSDLRKSPSIPNLCKVPNS
uniref:Uncharacterized protein n=1 Tax=Denticeps clupeoides TaxID=299321 RepID=A0AAY4CLE5_9TELE